MRIDPSRVEQCYATVRDALLGERNGQGHWIGELSTSALSTATAVMALEQIRRQQASGGHQPAGDPRHHSTSNADDAPRADAHGSPGPGSPVELQPLIDGGLRWLAEHQNDDGGWGDTTKSFSNISTTMLAHASFHAVCSGRAESGLTDSGSVYGEHSKVVERAAAYIGRIGGVAAVVKRYGKDKTFSIPILTHCALAGLVSWKEVSALPFELACLPPNFYKTVRLPVVSYALPALIAIGQVRHHFRKPWNPVLRAIRRLAIKPSLRRLESIQPSNGGFLEAAPLTSFVTMSLAGMGLADHPVAKKGLQFLLDSVRDDGSWPIDTNLATWVTTMSVAALGDDLPEAERRPIRDWLLGQQYREVHPYTNADPGAWAWTDLPGGVPDADDTPGAMLALMTLSGGDRSASRERKRPEASGGRKPAGEVGASLTDTDDSALKNAANWLLDLQNRDGGFPTFCRGWGTLPFDRSSPDITAHSLRALVLWRGGMHARDALPADEKKSGERYRSHVAIWKAFDFLQKAQRPDGSWLPLWFGNQHAPDDINPTYGTAKVLAAYRDCNRIDTPEAQRGLEWLRANQNDDGGWGGVKGTPSSVEETSLAVEILLSVDPDCESAERGLCRLLDCVQAGAYGETAPIGFYFAKLWYFEKLYPLSLIVAALRRAVQLKRAGATTSTNTEAVRNTVSVATPD